MGGSAGFGAMLNNMPDSVHLGMAPSLSPTAMTEIYAKPDGQF